MYVYRRSLPRAGLPCKQVIPKLSFKFKTIYSHYYIFTILHIISSVRTKKTDTVKIPSKS